MTMPRSGCSYIVGMCTALAWAWYGAIPGAQAQGPTRAAAKFYPDFSDTADALLRNETLDADAAYEAAGVPRTARPDFRPDRPETAAQVPALRDSQ